MSCPSPTPNVAAPESSSSAAAAAAAAATAAVATSSVASSSRRSASDYPPDQPLEEQRKRRQITVACNKCRKRKIKCDGSRPTCSPCLSRQLTCQYEADPDATPIVALKRKFEQLQKQSQDTEELLEMLKSRSEAEAIAILKRIRSGNTLSTTLSLVRDGDLLMSGRRYSSRSDVHMSPSESEVADEFELPARQPAAYPYLRPVEMAPTEQGPYAPDFGSVWQAKAALDPKSQHSATKPGSPTSHASQASVPQSPLSTRSTTTGTSLFTQLPPQGRRQSTSRHALYDERLEQVDATNWTSVVVDNKMFAAIISSFLTWDHPPLRFFDEDLFLDDLLAGRSDFCSKVLVNAVLAYGCLNYSAIEPLAGNLQAFFFVQAKQIWQMEEGKESVTCVAASNVMHCFESARGKDKIGHAYLIQGVRMSKDLGLFRKKEIGNVYRTAPPRIARGRAVTAWAQFSHIVLTSMYMHKTPELSRPPPVEIPLTDDSKLWGAVPREAPCRPGFIGTTFKVHCELWLIVNDLLPLYYGEDNEDVDAATLVEHAKRIHSRLLGWAETLPAEMKQRSNAPPHVLCLHMHYHCAVAELFRPLTGDPAIGLHRSLALEASAASMQQLKWLVHHTIHEYGGPPVSVWVYSALLAIIFDTMPHLDEESSRFFFLLAFRYLLKMVDQFTLCRFILVGVFHASRRMGITLPREAMEVYESIGGTHGSMQALDDVSSAYPVDLSIVSTDPEAARLSNIIRMTGNMAIG